MSRFLIVASIATMAFFSLAQAAELRVNPNLAKKIKLQKCPAGWTKTAVNHGYKCTGPLIICRDGSVLQEFKVNAARRAEYTCVWIQ